MIYISSVIESLQLRFNSQMVFSSHSHWLYPLFELEDFLKGNTQPREAFFLQDRIAGRAAASLIIRLGIKKCHIGIISHRAETLFQEHHIEFSFDQKVEKIDCRTEEWIKDDWTLDQTWLFLKKRAGRVQGVSLELDQLTAGYPGNRVLEKVNLKLSPGEQLVLRGENGSGKTTLLRTILGLQPLISGSITMDHLSLGSTEWKKNRHITGFLPQQNREAGFPISAGEVAATGLAAMKLSKEEALYRWEIALRQTGSFHLKDRLWDQLSGGEKQRLSLARCLCQEAKILLIDEPTSYLDKLGKHSLLDALHRLVLDVTPSIILVSHDDSWLKDLGWDSMELSEGRLC